MSTSGSTASARAKKAKRSVPAAVAAGRTRANAWISGARVSGFTALVVGLVVFGILALAPSLQTLVQQRQQIADLQSTLAQNKANLAAATAQEARWSDPAYVRAQARERLYYVMPGEINFLVIKDVSISGTQNQAPTTEVTTTDTNWVDGALTSVLVAGLTTSPLSGSH